MDDQARCTSFWVDANRACVVTGPHDEHNDGLGARWASSATQVPMEKRHEHVPPSLRNTEPIPVKWIAVESIYPIATKSDKKTGAVKGKADSSQEPIGANITVRISQETWDTCRADGRSVLPTKTAPVFYRVTQWDHEADNPKPKEPESVGLFAQP